VFEQPAAGFTMRTADLSRPVNQDRLAHQAVVEYLATITAPEPGIVASVRTIIRPLLPTGAAAINVVAAQFDMHPRALQRQLATENTTFTEILDRVHRNAVERYLRDTEISMSHMSREMGYAEQRCSPAPASGGSAPVQAPTEGSSAPAARAASVIQLLLDGDSETKF
jgi:AraC-like DNA-binding protein